MARRAFSSIPPRLFRAIRLVPRVGDAMLWVVDAAFGPHALLLKRIRSGPLRGMNLEVDPRALDMVIDRYEPTIQEALQRELRPGDVCFDIGANLGYFTLVMAQAVGPDGRVVSFEPDPEMVAALRRNVGRNVDGSKRVILVAAAVGAVTGRIGFVRGWRATRGRIAHADADIEVEMTTVDAAAERFGMPKLLKIDVEGAEAEVLQGARAVLENERPFVVVEVHSAQLEERCVGLLEAFGYTCRRRLDRGKKEAYLVAN